MLAVSILIRDARPARQRGCVVSRVAISSLITPLELLPCSGFGWTTRGNPRPELTRHIPDRSPDLS